ncbi:MAG: hypothetical protein IKS41_03795 [Alphaproteobacteria bacterium]|nr:hypothetical protein [Alphaproteobacteria bacterium]
MNSKIFKMLFCFIGMAIIGGGMVMITRQGWADSYQHHVEYQGRTLNYAYYVPNNVTEEPDALILVPGLNGRGEHMINPKWIALSNKTGRPIIAPSFVFEGDIAFLKNESYQFPNAWSGGALNAILDQFAEKGIRIQHLYMAGFSAGAQFVGRYSLAHPNKVVKCAIGASGGNDPIDYASPVKFFYAIGEKDQANRRFFADEFAKQAASYGVSVIQKKYPNTGHSFTPEMENDFINFLKK